MVSTHRPGPGRHDPRPHLDPTSPWVVSVRELGRSPGNMRSVTRTVPGPAEPARLGLETIYVDADEPVELDLRLESVTEGVYVSGTVRAALVTDRFPVGAPTHVPPVNRRWAGPGDHVRGGPSLEA